MTKQRPIDDLEAEESDPGISLLFGEIGSENIAGTIAWILSENFNPEPPEELTLIINSQGGSLSDAFALIEIMRGSRIPINTLALGEVASAGLLIFMSGAKRTITPSCSVMSHHFSAGISGTFHDLINAQKEWNFTQQRIVNHYVACTGMTPDKVKDLMLSKTDAYLTPTEALELGLADEVRVFGESPT